MVENGHPFTGMYWDDENSHFTRQAKLLSDG